LLNPETGRLDYVNAGHPQAFLVHADGNLEELAATGVPAGLMDLPGIEFEKKSVQMTPGSILVIYSDGISEAEQGPAHGEEEGARPQFGDEELPRLLRAGGFASAEDCARKIHDALERWLGGARIPDDTTLVVVRRAE